MIKHREGTTNSNPEIAANTSCTNTSRMKMLLYLLLSIILLLSYSTTPTSSSKLTSSSSTSRSEPKCISVDSYHTYICTDNPEASRRAVSSSINFEDGTVSMPASAFDMDLGVEQRITGSENEQLRIRNVLRKMYTYFEEEVLSRSEYEHVRGRW